MAHNLVKINGVSSDLNGDVTVSTGIALSGAVAEVTHSATPNNASVGDYAQILFGIYTTVGTNSDLLEFVPADASAIKSNSNYFMGVKLNKIGAYYIEAVMKFSIGVGESIVVQMVDSSNSPVGPKALYTYRNYIHPSTIHAVINNQTVGSNYYFRVQAVSGTVGQPTTNYGSSYFKCIKL